MSGQVSDSDRKKLEAALAAALLLIYQGHAKTALRQLGRDEDALTIPDDVKAKINAFAEARAQLIQTGINQRIDKAQAEDDAKQATAQALDEIKTYNASVLLPFMASWAKHQAVKDVYQTETIDGEPVIDKVQWSWFQRSDYPDDCRSAMEASPASWKTLTQIAQGSPPVHVRCSCSLDPMP